MSIVSSLNIAKEALAVNQAAITVASNNIANVDTKGYSKLRADQATVVGVSDMSGDSAIIEAESLCGVKLTGVTRYSDSFLQGYYQEQNSVASYYSKYSASAGQVESLVNQFQNAGLSDALDKFYTAANALSNSPKDITARSNYVSAAQNVCSVFNQISTNLSNIQKSLVGTSSDVSGSDIQANVNSVNGLLDQITEVNRSLIGTNTGATPDAALLDKRDSLVTELSSLINVKTSENANGTIDITLGNNYLVSGRNVEGYLKVSNSSDVSGNTVTTVDIVDPDNTSQVKVGNVNSDITGGSIGAILDFCGTNTSKFNVSGVMTQINNMANSFATVMNNLQTQTNANGTPMCMNSTGTALSPTTTPLVNIFTTSDASATVTAANISVNATVVSDPYRVAAARVTNTTDLTATGNNSNMTEVIKARTDSSYFATTPLAGSNVESYMATMVSGVGSDVKSLKDSSTTQTKVLTSIGTQLSSVTGVNLDEELSDLIKYQRAYQAAARVFSVCNELLNDMVNLGR